jgi:hypothetical protein
MLKDLALDAVKLLVLRKMVGKEDHLKMLMRWINNGESIGDLVREYDVERHAVRGLKDRFMRKIGSYQLGSRLITITVPHILEKVPVVIEKRTCMLCGRTLLYSAPEDHLNKRHRKIVEEYTKRVLREALEAYINANNIRVETS